MSPKRVLLHGEEFVWEPLLQLLVYDLQSGLAEQVFLDGVRARHAVVLLVDHEALLRDVLLHHDHPVLLQRLLAHDQEVLVVAVLNVVRDPLHPNAVLLVFGLELLQPQILLRADLVPQRLFGLCNEVRAGLHKVDHLEVLREQFLRDPADPRAAVQHPVVLHTLVAKKLI